MGSYIHKALGTGCSYHVGQFTHTLLGEQWPVGTRGINFSISEGFESGERQKLHLSQGRITSVKLWWQWPEKKWQLQKSREDARTLRCSVESHNADWVSRVKTSQRMEDPHMQNWLLMESVKFILRVHSVCISGFSYSVQLIFTPKSIFNVFQCHCWTFTVWENWGPGVWLRWGQQCHLRPLCVCLAQGLICPGPA